MLRLIRVAFIASHVCGHAMGDGFRVAITGTPGVGKTSVSGFLEAVGFTVVSVEELAEEHGCIGDEDPEDGARPIDVGKLGGLLSEVWAASPSGMVAIDGHLSHRLPVDAVVVLRCSPEVLKRRLHERGYSESKVNSNYEWELMGGSWNDSDGGVPWTEFDTTASEVVSVVDEIEEWASDGFKPKSLGSTIDWVARMEES
ncbi:MAG: NMP kinase [Euryarchaeota archaeon]|nr:NMP kinase [Euryarchaeota archaeon]